MHLSQFDPQKLFLDLYNAKDEEDIEYIILNNSEIFQNEHWTPLGNNTSNYGVVKNQQSNPIAALIEKITNSIDAILMKECFLNNIDPKSQEAPQNMEEAIFKFFPNNNWDLSEFRKKQAEKIQIIADGKGPQPQIRQYPTSVIIYDDGEGQDPTKFHETFLSLLTGNKNDIQFVQGKYTMGGSGSIVFCGKKRYQLIASKRYNNKGLFGFTLIREHPKNEKDHSKETWYEYLNLNGEIPSFDIKELDLGLEGIKFKTGTVIKLYSYQFPKGYSAFSQDLNQSINEYLFNPALPILTKDIPGRYPNNKILVTDLMGLKWRLYKEEKDYLEEKFTENYKDDLFGDMYVSCFVFKNKVKDYDLKKTESIIEDRYFKNSMAVLFSLNGQVHGHYSSEFISRSLKKNLLKKHLLIHVDCTNMNYNFRKELFMASRDRLKDGEETQALRKYLADKLSAPDGRLSELEKRRKQAVDIDSSASTKELLRSFTRKMPLNSELMKLLSQTFKIELTGDKKDTKEKSPKSKDLKEEVPFNPKRFPTKFKLVSNNDSEIDAAKIPLGEVKNIKFETDVEDDYFDRIDEPGELLVALLKIKNNDGDGGDRIGIPKGISDYFNVIKRSPYKGNLKISLNPKNDTKVGDTIQLKVTLTSPDENFDQIFWVKIGEHEQPKDKKPKPEEGQELLGIPPLLPAYQDKNDKEPDSVSWEDVENATSQQIDNKTVMIPEVEGENLIRIYVNMDSTIYMDYRGKIKNPNIEQIELARRKYQLSVYFHTLFLYTITKNRGYQIFKNVEGKTEPEYVDLGSYLIDLFNNYYSQFILEFGGTEELLYGLGD